MNRREVDTEVTQVMIRSMSLFGKLKLMRISLMKLYSIFQVWFDSGNYDFGNDLID